MADAYRNLYQGTLPSAAASIASPSGGTPAATSWIVKGGAGGLCVQNTDSASRTFQLWINGSADANVIGWGTSANPITLGPGECRQLDAGEAVVLGPSDALYAVASVSGKLVINIGGDAVT